MTKTAKEWRELGYCIPDFVPDHMPLKDVEQHADGSITWRQSWDIWGSHVLSDEELN